MPSVVLLDSTFHTVALSNLCHGISESGPIGLSRSSHNFSGLRIDYVAHRVDGGNRADHYSGIAHVHAGRSDAAFHGRFHSEQLADGRAGSSAHIALGDFTASSRLTSLVSGFSVGTDLRIAYPQVKENRSGNNRYDTSAELEADAMFLQISNHADWRHPARTCCHPRAKWRAPVAPC